jgi:hypothetical protein
VAALDPSGPADKFTPRPLDVDVPDNLASVFVDARRLASGEHPHSLGEKHVVILTPGRAMISIPALPKEALSPDLLAGTKKWLGPESRDITVVSYTKLEALMDEDHGKIKCVPFLPKLCILAAAGHNVVVFEGHPSALELGLRDTDVLIIDSGMLPFLQDDWMKVAVRVMRPGATYFFCEREQQNLLEIRPASKPPGWIYKQPDGEASYAYCLLTILGKRSGSSAALASGGMVPDLKTLTDNPDELEWAAALQFDYNRLDADLVIKTILKLAGVTKDRPLLIPGLKRHCALNARLQQQGGTVYCPFRLTLSGFGSRRHLEILREDF